GILYFPNDEVDFSGNNAASGCVTIVADTLNLTGSSTTTDKCTGASNLPTVAGGGVAALVE
ncbi:MAG: hypothetical protein ACRD3W_28850, partial [Terriglobales bacterium]